MNKFVFKLWVQNKIDQLDREIQQIKADGEDDLSSNYNNVEKTLVCTGKFEMLREIYDEFQLQD